MNHIYGMLSEIDFKSQNNEKLDNIFIRRLYATLSLSPRFYKERHKIQSKDERDFYKDESESEDDEAETWFKQ